nr:MAG TPA: hypothetical protein [Caudoviricetes sp.]
MFYLKPFMRIILLLLLLLYLQNYYQPLYKYKLVKRSYKTFPQFTLNQPISTESIICSEFSASILKAFI